MTAVLPKGAVVVVHDEGALLHGRPVEKAEGRGKVIDHYRSITGQRSTPYLVRLDDGRTGWYDRGEVARRTVTKGKSKRHPISTSPLDGVIALQHAGAAEAYEAAKAAHRVAPSPETKDAVVAAWSALEEAVAGKHRPRASSASRAGRRQAAERRRGRP